MIREVRFSSAARTDVVEAAQYYAEVEESLGTAFLESVLDLAHSLADSPRRYKEVRPGIRQALLRRFPYFLLYSVEGEVVLVVAVVSNRRDPAYVERLLSGR